MTTPIIFCNTCARYLGQRTCEAFDDEIPLEIFEDGFDHTKPFEGDHGMRYIPRPLEGEELIDR